MILCFINLSIISSECVLQTFNGSFSSVSITKRSFLEEVIFTIAFEHSSLE